MKFSNVLFIFTIGVLATAYAGVLQSGQEAVHENETKFKLHINTEGQDFTKQHKFRDVSLPPSSRSDTQPQDMKDIDDEELSEFLPVGSSYAGKEHKISEFDLGYDAGDATGPPPEAEDHNEPNSASLPSMVSSRIWILFAIVLAKYAL